MTPSQAKPFDAGFHDVAAISHLIHARDEIEVFLDAEILPKAEFLRHVTDLPFDRFTLANHIVAEAGAASGVRAQKAAEHANERCLTAAVWSQEPKDFAGAHFEIDVIDDCSIAEAFRHSTHVDGEPVGHTMAN